jgi:hypothetical protein
MTAGRRRAAGAAFAVAVTLAAVLAGRTVTGGGPVACKVLPAADVARIAAGAAPVPFEPENTGIKATGCSYGRGPGVNITVFSVADDRRALMLRNQRSHDEHGVVATPLKGRGYVGYTTPGPRPGSESVVVVKHDHYVDIIVFNAVPGTAEQLAHAAARALD